MRAGDPHRLGRVFRDLGVGSLGASAAPLAMPEGALLLFDAAAGVLTTGTPPFETGSEHAVVAWQNQGSGASGVDPGAAYRPVWSPGVALGAWAGVPYVRFDGADVLLLLGGFYGDGSNSPGQDWTFLAVAEQTAGGTRRFTHGAGNSGIFGFNNTRLAAFSLTPTAYRDVESGTPTTPRTESFAVRMNATNTRGWLGRDEANASPALAGQTTYSGASSGFLGAANATGTSGLVGKIYLLAAYDRSLSDAELSAAWDYLESRFPAAF